MVFGFGMAKTRLNCAEKETQGTAQNSGQSAAKFKWWPAMPSFGRLRSIMNLDAFEKFHIPLQYPLLLLKGKKGLMGCGYLNVETFNRTGEAGVIVRGVNTHEDMLKVKVVAVSDAARALGIEVGMMGEEALQKLQ
jgi:uncharacterized protein YunC (DUF1805 family)